MKLHFIAIGGTGMGALALMMKAAGHEVRGSDEHLYPPMSLQLERAGIRAMEGFSPANLDWQPDCVVVGNICRKDHVEVVEAQARGIVLESFPSLLEKQILPTRRSLVVAGTHGKTTTTSLLAWLLRASGNDPSWLIGGVPMNTNRSSSLGQGSAIVLEGDEYDTAFFDKKSKFLHYRPQRAILTNVEFDHADIFDSIVEVRAAFAQFVALIAKDGHLVVNAEDVEAMDIAKHAVCTVVPYRLLAANELPSEDDNAIYTARITSGPTARRMLLTWYERGVWMGEVASVLVGRHNASNLLAALAVARLEGVDAAKLAEAAASFRGVKRRQELAGVAHGVRVIDDFAHHPTAVAETVRAVRRRFPEQSLYVCFEPRSATSRRSVFQEAYQTAFAEASQVFLGPLYAPERIAEEARLDVEQLAKGISANGVPARALSSSAAIADEVAAVAGPGDTVLVMSSGSFDGLVEKILGEFGDAVVRGGPEDATDIAQLLREYGLPDPRTPESLEMLVIRDGHTRELIGCVNLEIVGEDALLFGLAVRRSKRGEGLGWTLADYALRRARTLGVRRVHLVAGDSADFFATKWGFRPGEGGIANAPASVRQMANCVLLEAVDGGLYMVRTLPESHG